MQHCEEISNVLFCYLIQLNKLDTKRQWNNFTSLYLIGEVNYMRVCGYHGLLPGLNYIFIEDLLLVGGPMWPAWPAAWHGAADVSDIHPTHPTLPV